MSQPSERQGYTINPIGLIHSPYTEIDQTPIQPARSNASGWVEVFPEFTEGLHSLEGFSHIILLYIFHKSHGYKLQVKPFLDDKVHGVFSTRYPFRPNPIGLSIVRLLACRQNLLEISGVDVLDSTPLIDIKPFIPEFDVYPAVKTGWYAQRSKQ